MIRRRIVVRTSVVNRFRTPGRRYGPAFGITLLSVVGVGALIATVEPVSASQEAAEVEELVYVGVAEARTNSSRAMDVAKSRARLDAIRHMLESRLQPDQRWDALSPNVREVINALVVGYLKSGIDLDKIGEFETLVQDRTVTVELRVPAEELDPYRLTLDGVVDLGWERARSGTPVSFLERAAILEVMGVDDSRRAALIEAMCPVGGAVVSSRTGSWGAADGAWSLDDPKSGVGPFSLWLGPLRRLVADDRALPHRPAIDDGGGTLTWDAGGERRLPVEELMMLAFRSWNAPALLQSIEERLRVDGWPKTAQLFETKVESPRFDSTVLPRVERGEARIQAIESVFGSTRLLRQYLSEGTAMVGVPSPSGPEFKSVAEAFNTGTPESFRKAAELLALAGTSRWLSVDEWNLLAATMFALEEPAMARAFATTAFRLQPEHPYAGVNLLRAIRALGLREEATRLMGLVETQATLNNWGRQRLAEVSDWLDESVIPAPEAFAPQSAEEGVVPADSENGS